ncbi:hypothetical protein VPH35_122445 [Triticum aestivum]
MYRRPSKTPRTSSPSLWSEHPRTCTTTSSTTRENRYFHYRCENNYFPRHTRTASRMHPWKFRFRSGLVRIRLTTSVCLRHGLVLLPSGISGKMTIPSKSLLSLLASCSLYSYAYAAIPTLCYIMPPILSCQASNPPCPSKPLFGYVTALLTPSYSVVSCR